MSDSADNLAFLILFFEPVRAHLEDEDVSEILINGADQVYVERKGRLERTACRFVSEPALKAAAVNVARSVGRVLNEEQPRLDARLPDGSRVHAVIPPLARNGTVVSIRKFKKDRLTMEKLVSSGSLGEEGARLLDTCVKLHKNILVSGATSSGKTSVLNVLSRCIQPHERILVIEDAAELQLQQEHVVSFETRRPDDKGKGEVTIRDLLHSALRLRPDRLVIGEIRGGEALDMLQAMNTGHAGSLSTLHANSPLDCLSRVETCALFSGIDLPLSALRSQVASAIDLVVHTARLVDGTRKVTEVSEVLPLEGGEYRMRSLYGYEVGLIRPDAPVEGRHRVRAEPTFAEEARLSGLPLPPVEAP